MLPLTAKSFSPRYESPKICDPYFGHCLSLTAPPLCSLDIIHHTSHIIHHTSHIIYHTSFTHHTSHITHHTSYITHHTSYITHHTSHITHHTLHITHHTPHIINHNSTLSIRVVFTYLRHLKRVSFSSPNHYMLFESNREMS